MVCSPLKRSTPWACGSAGGRRGSKLSSTMLVWLMPSPPPEPPKPGESSLGYIDGNNHHLLVVTGNEIPYRLGSERKLKIIVGKLAEPGESGYT